LPKVVPLQGKAELHWDKGTIAIPAPLEVDALIKSVPRMRSGFVIAVIAA
jgi:hypothetical protein